MSLKTTHMMNSSIPCWISWKGIPNHSKPCRVFVFCFQNRKMGIIRMENLLKLVKSIESTHKGLGLPLSFNALSSLAGQSIFNVGSSGKGKTHMIYSLIEQLKKLPNTKVDNWNAVTYYELLDRIGIQMNKNLLWTVEEWSMLSPYHQELLLAISSKIATDGNFERLFAKGTQSHIIKINNCTLTLIIAIQPFKFTRLMKMNETWNSIASDRFLKFMLVNPLAVDTKKIPPQFTLPDCAFIPKTFDFKPNPILAKLFGEHLTPGRAELASVRYQEAWCRLNDQEDFTNTDAIMLHAMYHHYLELYPLLIRSQDPDSEESFYTGAFRVLEYFMLHYTEDITAQQLCNAFHMLDIDGQDQQMSLRTMYRHLKILTKRGIVEPHNPDYSHYILSTEWRKFFENYKERWST